MEYFVAPKPKNTIFWIAEFESCNKIPVLIYFSLLALDFSSLKTESTVQRQLSQLPAGG